jgi:hypothetical protein
MKQARTKLIAASVFVLVCAAIGTLFYLKFTTVNNEQQFNQVLADMQQLKASLQSHVPNVHWQLQSSCDQAHEVYTKGNIGCTIGIAYQTTAQDEQTLRAVITGFNNVLTTDSSVFAKLTSKVTPAALDVIATGQPGSTGDVFKHVKTGMQCSSYIGITQDKPHLFALLFQCTGEAERMYFPSNPVG